MSENQEQPTQPDDEVPPDWRKCYSEDGVDLTLIDWMLSLTPLERLRYAQRHAQAIMRLRNGNESHS